jgi:hypothetical protein
MLLSLLPACACRILYSTLESCILCSQCWWHAAVDAVIRDWRRCVEVTVGGYVVVDSAGWANNVVLHDVHTHHIIAVDAVE